MTTETISTPLDLAVGRSGAVSDALSETLRRCEETGRSVFLFGGDAVSIRAIRECVSRQHPRLRIAGICDADFSGSAGPAILKHIASCKPDVVVADLAPSRHRALIAEVAAAGLRFTLVNRPGSFAGGRHLASMRQGPIGKAASTLATALRFSGVILRQFVRKPARIGVNGGR